MAKKQIYHLSGDLLNAAILNPSCANLIAADPPIPGPHPTTIIMYLVFDCYRVAYPTQFVHNLKDTDAARNQIAALTELSEQADINR